MTKHTVLLSAVLATGCGSTDLIDDDGDGFSADVDCDDTDASVSPGADEVPYNGVDDDCNRATLDDDLDRDGVPAAEDCDDADPRLSPVHVEVPYNGLDDDCSADTSDDDVDGDGVHWELDCDDQDANAWDHGDAAVLEDPATFCDGYCTRGVDGDLDLTVLDDLTALSCVNDVRGSVWLYSSDWTDLSGLDQLNAVHGDLYLGDLAIQDLSGLDALELVDGDVLLDSLPDLTTLEGSALHTVGGDLVVAGTGVADLTGLETVESVGGALALLDNVYLTDTAGVENLASLAGLAVAYNPALQEVALPGLAAPITGDLWLEDNPALTTLDMASPTELSGGLWLAGHLPGLDALHELRGAGEVTVTGTELTDLTALANLDRVETLAISGNADLAALSLTHLDDLGGLAVQDNPKLCATDVDDLAWQSSLESWVNSGNEGACPAQ